MPDESIKTTPSEYFKSIYGDKVSDIIKKRRDYQKQNPDVAKLVYMPDYSEETMSMPVELKSYPDDGMTTMAKVLDGKPEINIRSDLFKEMTTPNTPTSRTIGHEMQHVLQTANTDTANELRKTRNKARALGAPYSELDSDPEFKQFANDRRREGDYRVPTSPAELPGYISDLKARRFDQTGSYPEAATKEDLIAHLNALNDEFQKRIKEPRTADQTKRPVMRNIYLKDVIDLLMHNPEKGLKYWNSIVRKDRNPLDMA